MNFSIFEIEELLEHDKFSGEMKIIVEILLSAINDWPSTVNYLYDFDLAVQNFIMNIPTKKNIELALSKMDVSKLAWEAESLSVLINVFNYFVKDISLKEILDNIKPSK